MGETSLVRLYRMRHFYIFSFILAIIVISASRLQTTPLLKNDDQPATTSSWWFGSILNKIYDWWYGKPSDCRDMVVWEPEDTSAEEWHPRSDESSGSGAITSWSTSSGSEKEKKGGKKAKSKDDLSKSVYEMFFAKGEADEKPVWKASLDSTAEPTVKQSLEAPETTLEGENLDSEDVFKRTNPIEESLK